MSNHAVSALHHVSNRIPSSPARQLHEATCRPSDPCLLCEPYGCPGLPSPQRSYHSDTPAHHARMVTMMVLMLLRLQRKYFKKHIENFWTNAMEAHALSPKIVPERLGKLLLHWLSLALPHCILHACLSAQPVYRPSFCIVTEKKAINGGILTQ